MCANFGQEYTAERFGPIIGKQIKTKIEEGKRSVYPIKPAVIVHGEDRKVDEMLWGMAPQFADDWKKWTRDYSTSNAKSETIQEKVSFKTPWKNNQRCVIFCDWFLEWNGPQGKKKKVFVSDADSEITALAGIWDFHKKDGSLIFTMITTEPNAQIKPIIEEKTNVRVPVVLTDWQGWLSADLSPEEASDFCIPHSGKFNIEILDRSPKSEG